MCAIDAKDPKMKLRPAAAATPLKMCLTRRNLTCQDGTRWSCSIRCCVDSGHHALLVEAGSQEKSLICLAMPLRMLTCSGGIFAKGTFHISACTWGAQRAHPTRVVGLQLGLTFRSQLLPPKFKILTKILHPNIGAESGKVCLDILSAEYSTPALSLGKLLLSVVALLAAPEPHDPVNVEAAALQLSHPELFAEKARLWTRTYALPEPPSFRDLGIGTKSSLWCRATVSFTESP